MTAYYNENDAKKAARLRALIAAGVIAAGDVDERSITDVQPEDVRGYTQCHFFAGTGIWSYALRAAGWPDAAPIWTGSCPCQSFSASGKRAGFGDDRHLWPAWFRLIGELRPERVFGEQVASRDGLAWFDLVSADLEGAGYAVGAADTCAAGFGAPQISQRLWFMAEAHGNRLARTSVPAGLAESGAHQPDPGGCSTPRKLVPTNGSGLPQRGHGGTKQQAVETEAGEALDHAGAVSGYWGGADWILRRRPNGGGADWCPVEPGTFPLAYGLPRSFRRMPAKLQRLAEMAGLDSESLRRAKGFRIDALRAWGDAIVAPQAEAFIRAYLEERAAKAQAKLQW